MDSKNIFLAANHMKGKIDWNKQNDNEWSYVGDKNNFQNDQVMEFINQYFEEAELYFVIDRHNAYSIPKEQATIELQNRVKNRDAIVCNHSFTRMIEFNHIGVARYGKYLSV